MIASLHLTCDEGRDSAHCIITIRDEFEKVVMAKTYSTILALQYCPRSDLWTDQSDYWKHWKPGCSVVYRRFPSRRLIHHTNLASGWFADRKVVTASGVTFPGTYHTCVAIRFSECSEFPLFMAFAGILCKKAVSQSVAVMGKGFFFSKPYSSFVHAHSVPEEKSHLKFQEFPYALLLISMTNFLSFA